MHSRIPDIYTDEPEIEKRYVEPNQYGYGQKIKRIKQRRNKTISPKRSLDPDSILNRSEMRILIVVLVDCLNVDSGNLHALFVCCRKDIKLELIFISGNILEPHAKSCGETS